MRAAKMNKLQGAGSMTLLPLVAGKPATGVTMKVDMSKYQTLSEEQKAKIKVGGACVDWCVVCIQVYMGITCNMWYLVVVI